MSKPNSDLNPQKPLFEIFTESDLKDPKMKKCLEQVMDFEYGICFAESLKDSLDVDESHELALVHADLCMEKYKVPKCSHLDVVEINNEDEPEEESDD